jgi:hypothetical protein
MQLPSNKMQLLNRHSQITSKNAIAFQKNAIAEHAQVNHNKMQLPNMLS